MILFSDEYYRPPDLSIPVILDYDGGEILDAIPDVILESIDTPTDVNFIGGSESDSLIEHAYGKDLQIIFFDRDKVKGNKGNNISIIFDEVMVEKTCSIYWNNSNNFDCFCSPPYTTTNDFQVSCFSTNDFGFIYSSYGDNLKSEIIGTILANSSHGEMVSSILDYRPFKTLESKSLYGDSLSLKTVSRNVLLSPKIGYGDSLRSNVKYTVAPNLDGFISDGSGLKVSIFYAVVNNLSPLVQTGDVANYTLNISTTMGFVSLYGENIKSSLTTNTTLNPIISHGSYIRNPTLTYKGKTLLDGKISTGDNFKNGIKTQSNFSPNINTGENYNINLKYAEGTRWITSVSTGENVSFDIVNSIFLSPVFSYGEGVGYELVRTDAHNLKPLFEIGDNFNGGDLSLSPSLLPSMYSGDNLSKITLDSLPNWYIKTGESVEASIAITKSFDNNNFKTGENLKPVIKYAFSEPIGTFDAVTGEDLYCYLDTLISTTFTSISSMNMGFEPTIWDTTYIDLNRNNGCCKPSKDDLLYVNLQRDKEVEIDYSVKDKLSMVADLSVVRLFDIDVRSGDVFKVDEYNNYFEVDCFYGSSNNTIDLYMDLDVNLSNGNTDYSGSIFIETVKDYQSIKTAFSSSFNGESVSFELSTYEKLKPLAYDGTRVDFSLWTVEAWRTRMTHGSRLYATLNTTMKIYPRFNFGDAVRGIFYEQPYIIGTGEGVTCDLVLDFDVEFLESGCLENNHIPTDKDGVPIIDDMNEMVIEGYYYSRYIKGRCY